MSLKLRAYFFAAMLDRLKNGDIPTEETFRHLLDSIALFKELSDTAQRAKGGLVKTTPDSKVNARDNSDVAGQSPLGFKTFVQPAQVPKVLAGANVTVTPVVRGTPVGGADDSGVGIEDYQVSVTLPPLPTIPTTTADLTTSAGITLNSLTGAYPYAVTPGSIAGGTNLQAALVSIAGEVNNLVVKTNDIADIVYAEQLEAVGDVELTMNPPGTWDAAKYIEPKGQSLSAIAYPELFNKIGYAYGGAGASFSVPNMTTAAYLRGVLSPSAQVGTMTGNADYALTVANIPEHSHPFSGTTDPDTHSHDINVYPDDPGNVQVDGNGPGGVASVDSTSIQPDTHSHTFSGTTGTYGSNPVTPIPLTPTAINFYLKYRIKP